MTVVDIDSRRQGAAHPPFRLELEVENVGPFEGFHTIGTIEPGVNLLVAENGSGKSYLMRLLVALSKRMVSAGDVTVNDQATGSTAVVKLGPAVMRAKLGRRPVREGHEDLPPIEALPSPIEILETGDHMKGQGPQFRRRLSALLKWLGLEATEMLRVELAGDDPSLRSWLRGPGESKEDLIELADGLRGECHRQRRECEATLAEAERELAARQGRREEVLSSAGLTPDEMAAAPAAQPDVAGAAARVAELRAKRQAFIAETARREELRGSLGEPPDLEGPEVELASAQSAAAQADEWVQQKDVEVQALRQRLAAAEVSLAEAQRRRQDCLLRRDEASARLETARTAQRRHRETMEQLERALAAPSDEDLAVAERQLAEQQRVEAVAKTRERYAAAAAAVEAQESVAGVIREKAEYYAALADEIWRRLAQAVNRELASDQVRVLGQSIELNVGGSWRDIADVDWISEGQRADACYELMLERTRGQRIVVVEGTTSVDEERLERIGEIARSHGVGLVFETQMGARTGEFELRHYGGAA